MQMDAQFLMFCLVGGWISADKEAAGQLMISQPMVGCSIAGAILGDVLTGLLVGTLVQLPFLVEVPAGGAKTSLINLGAFVAAGLALTLRHEFPVQTDACIMMAIFFGLFLSWSCAPFQRWLRQLNQLLVYKADRVAAHGDFRRISRLHYSGAALAFLFGVLYTAVFFLAGKVLLVALLERVPHTWEAVFHLAQPVLMGAGVGAMVWFFINQTDKIKFLLTGLLLGAIFQIF